MRKLTPERKLKYLQGYMGEFIDAWPRKIKPFESWVDSVIDKKINKSYGEGKARAKKVCAYCGRQFENTERTVDHIIPESKGGFDRSANRVYCCFECNQWKDNKSLEHWERGLLLLLKKEKKIRPPYTKNMVALMIRNIRKIQAQVKENIKSISTYKKID